LRKANPAQDGFRHRGGIDAVVAPLHLLLDRRHSFLAVLFHSLIGSIGTRLFILYKVPTPIDVMPRESLA
jgi:hypothetical protein